MSASTADRPANRLAGETSPYLLQHAHNPVDWYPWGPDALARAEAEDRPIFLSIGYSACHWCHVMENECFEDPEIAALMNDLFVNIKVDREERPDLDQIYMAAVQAFNDGHGGWPMSVFLTPAPKPVYRGGRFPPPGPEAVLRRDLFPPARRPGPARFPPRPPRAGESLARAARRRRPDRG